MKKKIMLMATSAIFVFTAGICIAYYNTETTGFNSEAKIISRDDEKISIMSRDIYYNDIIYMYNRVNDFVPKNVVVI